MSTKTLHLRRRKKHKKTQKKIQKKNRKKKWRGEADEGYLQEVVTKSLTEDEHDGHKVALLPGVTRESG